MPVNDKSCRPPECVIRLKISEAIILLLDVWFSPLYIVSLLRLGALAISIQNV